MMNDNTELLMEKELPSITGLSISTIYRMERKDLFPRRIKIGLRAVAWRVDDINKWMDERKKFYPLRGLK